MSRWRQWFWIALILALLSGWLPMLMAGFFPLPFRLIHGLEVTIDSIVYSVVIVWLLGSILPKTANTGMVLVRKRPQPNHRVVEDGHPNVAYWVGAIERCGVKVIPTDNSTFLGANRRGYIYGYEEHMDPRPLAVARRAMFRRLAELDPKPDEEAA